MPRVLSEGLGAKAKDHLRQKIRNQGGIYVNNILQIKTPKKCSAEMLNEGKCKESSYMLRVLLQVLVLKAKGVLK